MNIFIWNSHAFAETYFEQGNQVNNEEKIPTLVINIPGIATRGSQSADEFGKNFFPSYEKYSVQYEGVASKIPLINLLPWFKPGEKPGTKNVITIPQRLKNWQQESESAWNEISQGFTHQNNVVVVNIDQNKIIPAQLGNLGGETLIPALQGSHFVTEFKKQFPNGRVVMKTHSDGDWIGSSIIESVGSFVDVWIQGSPRLPYSEKVEILGQYPNIKFVSIGAQGDLLNVGVQGFFQPYSGYARQGGDNYLNIEVQSKFKEVINPVFGRSARHSIVENYSKELPLKITTPNGTIKSSSLTIKEILYPIVTGKVFDGDKKTSREMSLYLPVDDSSKKYYGDDYKKYFPPPPPPPDKGGLAIPGRDHPVFKGQAYPASEFDYGRPGGILLDMPVDIVGLNNAEVTGAKWDDEKKQLFIIVKGEVVSFPKSYLDDFVSILMTVYGGEAPGISIDPGGFSDQCTVRYIGKVKNTRFGMTLFEADRLLKSLSLGKDTLTGYPINPGIPGFKTMVQLFEEKGMNYSGALYRFWFLPLEMRIKQKENAFVFDSARLQVKSEYMFKKGKKSETEPAAEEFANFLTEHYDEFAWRYPVLKNLAEYAKMVSIALWLKEQDVPLNWFLLANSYTENVETPDITPAMYSDHPDSVTSILQI